MRDSSNIALHHHQQHGVSTSLQVRMHSLLSVEHATRRPKDAQRRSPTTNTEIL